MTTTLAWDQEGSKYYSDGLDRGVLYLSDGTGVVWNGLFEVARKSGTKSKPVYYDGAVIHNTFTTPSFTGTLKAYMYPDQFEAYDGSDEPLSGVLIHEQRPNTFGLSWRTKITKDTGVVCYRIHLLYNVSAIPETIRWETERDTPIMQVMTWKITAVPGYSQHQAPSSYVTFDTEEVPTAFLESIERQLYGDGSTIPTMPSYEALMQEIEDFYKIEIIDNNDGTWTLRTQQDGLITYGPDGDFRVVGTNAQYADADTFVISSSKE